MNILPFLGIGTAVAIGTGIIAFFYHKGKSLEKTPISFSEFTNQLGKQIDRYMLDEEKRRNVDMYGGECSLSIPENDPENVVMDIVLYGKKKDSSDEKWLKSNITQRLKLSEFTDDPETLSRLEALKTTPEKFKVTRPEKE